MRSPGRFLKETYTSRPARIWRSERCRVITVAVSSHASSPKTGRPRQFDADRAVVRAMRLFWKNGYDGTSMTDLTRAMGINAPSLYGAFGDKAGLFRAALDRYQQLEKASYVDDALAQPTARAFAERLLRGAADNQTKRNHPGCLMVQGALGRTQDPSIRKELERRRSLGLTIVRRRLERAQRDGDLPADADPAGLARYLVAVVRGMAIEAAGGATRKQLDAVINIALAGWPRRRSAIAP
jgi:AcrR family transcriptional regulator